MRITTVVALAVSALVVVGCGQGNFKNSSANAESGVLRYPIPNNPSTIDPGVVQDGDTIDLLQQVYEGLVGWDENNEVVGLLAESWTVSDDGMEFTFKVREGVTFHDGSPLTADDIKRSIERACNSGVRSVTVDAYLNDIAGLIEMKQGKADSISGIVVNDPYSITFKLVKPTPYFLGKLTYIASSPVGPNAPDREMNNISQAVGTGPFKFVRYEENQLVVLEANENYWGGRPKLDRIERTVAIDAQSKLNQYKTGAFDIVQLQRQDVAALQADNQFKDQLEYFQRPSIWYVGMNQAAYAPFKDRRVRQAFAMSINRERIVNDLMGGINTVAKSIVPPGIKGHREEANGLPYDPARAKALLAEAGYPNGQGLPPLKMTHREGYPDIKLVAEAVAGQIEENLGVKVQVTPVEWRKYLEDYNAGNVHQIYHMRWGASYLDPQYFLSHMLTTTGPENKIGYSNVEFDRLCAEADRIMDYDARTPLYQRAEDIALQDGVWVPIYFQRDVELHRPEVRGIRSNILHHLPHKTTEIVREK